MKWGEVSASIDGLSEAMALLEIELLFIEYRLNYYKEVHLNVWAVIVDRSGRRGENTA